MSLALAAVTGILFAAGTWLLLQRRLTRIIIGIGLLGHGANLLLVTSGGRAGNPRSSTDQLGAPQSIQTPFHRHSPLRQLSSPSV